MSVKYFARQKWGILGLMCFLSASVFASNDKPLPIDRIFWDKTPIRLSLSVGQERLLHFPKPGSVQVGLPGRLNRGALRTQIVGNTVYWLAKEPFDRERVQIVNQATGETFLFDIEASETDALLPPIEIVNADSKRTKEKQSKAKKDLDKKFDYVTLTRFASQQLYAPTRLLKELPGLFRVPVDTETKVALVRGGKVEATPLIGWKGGQYYITAVRLQNHTDDYVMLDPRNLRGDWLTATFQHTRLFPAGDVTDTTSVYLISARPFGQSIY